MSVHMYMDIYARVYTHMYTCPYIHVCARVRTYKLGLRHHLGLRHYLVSKLLVCQQMPWAAPSDH